VSKRAKNLSPGTFPDNETHQAHKRVPASVWYAIGILALVNVFNWMDRMVLSILLPDIKADLHLSDTELGLLSGIAFAFFYAVFGFPLAWVVDRKNRKTILAVCISAWSAMTAMCGLAQNFPQMMLARIGVGVGEAGYSPSANSLLGDYLPMEKRSIGFAIISAGLMAGTMLGLILGGMLSELIGWRLTFVAMGAPGVIVAAIVYFSLREPKRGRFDSHPIDAPPSIGNALKFLWSQKAYVHLVVAQAFLALPGYGITTWMPSYFSRTYDLSQSELGLYLGVVLGSGSIIGALVGGYLASKAMSHDIRLGILISGVGLVMLIPLYFGVLYSDQQEFALGFYFIYILFGGLLTPPIGAILITLALPRIRGVATAIAGFSMSLVGLGLGPVVIGLLSDLFGAREGDDGLRIAMAVISLIYVIPLFSLWFASRTVSQDTARTTVQRHSGRELE